MKIASINFQCITNKFSLLDPLLKEYPFDIILGCETHIDPTILNSEIFPPNYNIVRNDRDRKGGGVLIAVLNTLTFEILSTTTTTESLFIRLQSKSSSYIIGCHYRPPSQPLPYSESFAHSLYDLHSRFPNSHFIVGGDFNLPHIDWESFSVLPNNPHKQISQALLDSFSDMGFTQIIKHPTRTTENSSNLLDLILTNNSDLVSFSEVMSGISDHDIPFSIHRSSLTRSPHPPRKIYMYYKADWNTIKSKLLDFQNNYFSNNLNDDIEKKWSLFKNTVHHLIENYIPHKFTKAYHSFP